MERNGTGKIHQRYVALISGFQVIFLSPAGYGIMANVFTVS